MDERAWFDDAERRRREDRTLDARMVALEAAARHSAGRLDAERTAVILQRATEYERWLLRELGY